MSYLALAKSACRGAVHLAEQLVVRLPATNADADDEVGMVVHALCMEYIVAELQRIIVVPFYGVSRKTQLHPLSVMHIMS